MPPAVIAAGVVAAGTIGGAVLGSHSQSQANEQAAQTQDNATAAQLQLGQQSLALQQQLAQQSMGLNQSIYNSNYDMLSPWVSRGNVAGDAYSALLGLPAAPAMRSPLETASGGLAPITPATTTPTPPVTQPGTTVPYTPPPTTIPSATGGSVTQLPSGQWVPASSVPAASPAVAASASPMATATSSAATQAPAQANATPLIDRAIGAAQQAGEPNPLFSGASGQSILDALRARFTPAPTPTGGTTPPAGGTTPPAGGGTPAAGGTATTPQQQAMEDFANSAGMQFQLEQGTNALNNMYAAHGMLQSGAAMKGINDYAQQTALQNYFMPYMGMLGGLSAQGAQAGAAVAGVGSTFGNTAAGINSNYGNSASAINAGMGNAINAGAQNIGNLQLANGQNQANMWGNIGGALGGLASSFIPVPHY